jgi:CHAT domain-containing protein/tetratricopeptide (TPR) repeat protein
MAVHYRKGRSTVQAVAVAVAIAMFAVGIVITGCSPLPAHYAAAIEAVQRDALESLRLEEDLRRQERLGRFDEAQQTAQTIKQRQVAKAQRCEEAWREAEEIKKLSDQGRYREMEQMIKKRKPAPFECADRPRKNDRDPVEQIDITRRNATQDVVSSREPLYVSPLELFGLEESYWAELPREAFSLLMEASGKIATGNFVEAEASLERALTLVRQVRGATHPAASVVLQSLSWLEEQRGKLPQAMRHVESAVVLIERARGADSRTLAPLLRFQSRLFLRSGNADRAIEVGKRAFSLYAGAGESSPAYGAALHNLGVVFHHQGDTQRALEAYQKSLEILRRNRETAATTQVAQLDWEMPSILSNVGLAHWQRGDLAQAQEYFNYAREAMAERDKTDSSWQTEHGALARAQKLALELDALLSLQRAIGASSNGTESVALQILLERKGAVLERQSRSMGDFRKGAGPDTPLPQKSPAGLLDFQNKALEQMRALQQPGATHPEDRELLAEYESVLAKRAALTRREPVTPEEQAARDKDAAALDTQIRVMQGQIVSRNQQREMLESAARSPPDPKALEKANKEGRLEAFVNEGMARRRSEGEAQRRLDREKQRAMLRDIQSRLPANAVLLEMTRYRPLDPRAGLPEERRWGPARYGSYLIRLVGPPVYIDHGEAQPIEKLITEFRKALARPRGSEAQELGRRLDVLLMQPIREQIGTLTQVFVAPEGMLNLLPFSALVDEQNRYLIETYTFNYLASGRDLLRENRDKPRTAPLIMADPAFDGVGEVAASERAPSALTIGERSRDFAGVKFDPLSGTAAEAQLLKQIIPDARVLTGRQATETALKQVKGPRILHIATHGFFLQDLDVDATGAGATRRRPQLGENPMLRSGLAFAGANVLRSGDDDGVLTAFEAAALDLNGTKLVILSACETGVGEVKNGEGVFGLRRAFAVAGAEALVMSLWPVADQATKELMVNYHQRLAKGEGRTEALRQTQLELLRDPRRSHPFYWASFIASGQSGSVR